MYQATSPGEYRWGKTDGGKYVRLAFLNAVGPDGRRRTMSIECQCPGRRRHDRYPGQRRKPERNPVKLKMTWRAKTPVETRRHAGEFTNRQLWWSNHDLDFQELIDTRGKNDGKALSANAPSNAFYGRITIRVNGTTVNQAYDVHPRRERFCSSEGRAVRAEVRDWAGEVVEHFRAWHITENYVMTQTREP